MRSQIVSLALAAAALIGTAELASAQSPYSYQWCSRQFGGREGSTTSCYFSSYQQCMTTVSGIGGYCYQNPGYRGSASAYGQASTARRHRRSHN
jgi:Protein of unknown function (DUF3551)